MKSNVPKGYDPTRTYIPADPAEYVASCNGRSYKGTPPYDLLCRCVCGAAHNDHHSGHCPKL